MSQLLYYMPTSREVSTVRRAPVALHEAGNTVRAISLQLHIPHSTVPDCFLGYLNIEISVRDTVPVGPE